MILVITGFIIFVIGIYLKRKIDVIVKQLEELQNIQSTEKTITAGIE